MIYQYNELVEIMEESFNYKMGFIHDSKPKFLKFVKNFMSFKTEYEHSDHFKKHYAKNVEETIKAYEKDRTYSLKELRVLDQMVKAYINSGSFPEYIENHFKRFYDCTDKVNFLSWKK